MWQPVYCAAVPLLQVLVLLLRQWRQLAGWAEAQVPPCLLGLPQRQHSPAGWLPAQQPQAPAPPKRAAPAAGLQLVLLLLLLLLLEVVKLLLPLLLLLLLLLLAGLPGAADPAAPLAASWQAPACGQSRLPL